MRRREFIAALGGAAAMPIAARAQQVTMPVVGFLSSRSPGEAADVVTAFLDGLRSVGYAAGQNVVVEYRWAEGQAARLPALAAEFIRRPVAVIAATGGPGPALATKQLTSTIPLVFIANDPVRVGLVASLNRPGGNATGVNVFLEDLESKRLGLLRELVPAVSLIAALINPSGPDFHLQLKDIEDSASTLGHWVYIVRAASQQEIDNAFKALAELKPGALLVCASPFFNSRREQIVALSNHYKIPAIYEVREFVMAGGLMSYGTRLSDAYRQVGVYTGRILKGEVPGELPVVRLTRFEFVINLRTARSLGIDVPGALSARADEIIE